MITVTKIDFRTGKVIKVTEATDNWYKVYQANARFEGRRIVWLSDKEYEIIFSEKGYKLKVSA